MIHRIRLQAIRIALPLLVLTLTFSACNEDIPPDPASEQYRDAVSAFYISLAAMQADQAIFAVEKMNQVAGWYPKEPAVWANLGVFSMRRGDFERATQNLEEAQELVPDNGEIQFLIGVLKSRQGNIEQAITHLERAGKLSPGDSQILYALISELERQDAKNNAESIQTLLGDLQKQQPDNLAVQLEATRIAAKLENQSLLEQSLNALTSKSGNWPEEIRSRFNALKEDMLSKPIENLTFEMAYLRNNLNQLPKFQADFNRIQLPPSQVGFLITDFMWLPEPSKNNEPRDEGLSFEKQALASTGNRQQFIRHISLADDNIPELLGVRGDRVLFQNGQTFPFPASGSETISPNSIETIDYNYDFLNDLVFAGPAGFKFYEQGEGSVFADVTAELGFSPGIINGSWSGVWKADIDLDGDLDLVLARTNGGTVVLRNNGDETFATKEIFDDVNHLVDFTWADLDADGDPDAVFLEKDGILKVYQNERAGNFKPVSALPQAGMIHSIEATDLNADSYLDLVALSDSSIQRVFYDSNRQIWESEAVVFRDTTVNSSDPSQRLFVSDFDNNGGFDLLVSGSSSSQLWLSGEKSDFKLFETPLPGSIYSVVDLTNDNRLDLVGLDNGGQPFQLVNKGTKKYFGKIIRPRASGPFGDRRINSFGIGGELEIRSGLLYQKQLITSPAVHVGLGTYQEAEMLRVIWPNGSVQAEFAELGYGSKIFNEQMLKGSCPWVFAYNGEEMEFVTDFLWRTALGLRINAQGEASVIHSIDRIKIEGDQLKPQNGYYDIRITAELWETHFFDHVSMLVVDHPEDTGVLVDERFILPPPEQKLYPVSPLRPIEKALDQDRKDVTGKVRSEDGEYVDGFPLTPYQGVAKEHYLEVHLGEDIPATNDPVYLVASGWVYPTDSSINVAISQGDQTPPHGIFLQVPDENGGWKTVKEDIGFPAGKTKTILIDLSDLPSGKIPGRVRLSTNMEIYWDQVSWTTGRPGSTIKTQKLQPEMADLRYRGFSKLNGKSRFDPEIPDYQTIAGTTPMWIDLIGYYTRFGDVRDLLQEIDDRYVIMNAGDELVFRFEALEPPPAGWERDFVLIGDGWVKDGDYNTGFSKTVIPLPYHGMKDYSETPGRLEDDPVYQKHKSDWATYHTRYVTTKNFQTALKINE